MIRSIYSQTYVLDVPENSSSKLKLRDLGMQPFNIRPLRALIWVLEQLEADLRIIGKSDDGSTQRGYQN